MLTVLLFRLLPATLQVNEAGKVNNQEIWTLESVVRRRILLIVSGDSSEFIKVPPYLFTTILIRVVVVVVFKFCHFLWID